MGSRRPKADMRLCAAHVRFWWQSRHDFSRESAFAVAIGSKAVLHRICLLLTQSGHFTLSEAAGVLVSPGTTATKRNNAVTSITMGLENTEQEILAFEVADVALEIAAGTAKGKANFTLGACTGLSECPG
jgi:hypothetical protein